VTPQSGTPWFDLIRMTFWKRIAARLSAHRSALQYLISLEADYLRAELIDQESLRQTRVFLDAVFRTSLDNLRSRVLICARSPKPVRLARCVHVLPDMKGIAWYRPNKIAIVRNRASLDLPDKDIQRRARQRGLNLSFFPDEAAALRWFHDRRRGPRRGSEADYSHDEAASSGGAVEDQRRQQDRRQAQRHIFPADLQLGV